MLTLVVSVVYCLQVVTSVVSVVYCLYVVFCWYSDIFDSALGCNFSSVSGLMFTGCMCLVLWC